MTANYTMNNSPRKRTIYSFLCISLMTAVLLMTVWSIFPRNSYAQVENKTVRIGWVEGANLMEGSSDDEMKSGLAYDYIQQISYYTGWKYEYVYGSWTEILSKLEAGEIDALCDVSKTPEREESLLYPDYAMGSENYYIYAHSDGPLASGDLTQLVGCSVGIDDDSIEKQLLAKWSEVGNYNLQIVPYSGRTTRLIDFDNGKVDATVDMDITIQPEDDMVPLTCIGKSDYYLALSKNRGDLLQELNNALQNIESTQPAFTKNLAYKYFSGMAVSSKLTNSETAWLKDHSVIRVGYFDNYLPFSDTRDDGTATGIITDIMKQMLIEMSLDKQVTIEYHGYNSEEQLTQALKSGKVDVAFPVDSNVALADKNQIALTSDVITTGMNLVFRGNYNYKKNSIHKIAIVRGNDIQEAYTKKNYPDAKYVYVDSIETGLRGIQNHMVDAMVLNAYRKDGFLNQTKYNNLDSMLLSQSSSRCMAVNHGEVELLSILNRGIRALPSNFAASATYPYLGRLTDYTLMDVIRDNILVFLLIVIIFIMAVGATIFYILYSRRKRALLYDMAHVDDMTKLLNRRAYDEDLEKIDEKHPPKDLLYISMDLNGLKYINDHLGHEAGDEVICGAADCMVEVLKTYGQIYRIGGDEYVAMLHVTPDQKEILQIRLNDRFNRWSGRICPHLSISMAGIYAGNHPDMTLKEIVRESDRQMYEDKNRYYQNTGINRRKF